MSTPYRRTLGAKFSEGARLAWEELARRGLTFADVHRATGIGRPGLTRLYYGDCLPSLEAAVKLQAFFGVVRTRAVRLKSSGRLVQMRAWRVPVESWTTPPTKEFVLPSLRTAA